MFKKKLTLIDKLILTGISLIAFKEIALDHGYLTRKTLDRLNVKSIEYKVEKDEMSRFFSYGFDPWLFYATQERKLVAELGFKVDERIITPKKAMKFRDKILSDSIESIMKRSFSFSLEDSLNEIGTKETFRTIAEAMRDNGIFYESSSLLTQSFREYDKGGIVLLDCDELSYLFISVARELGMSPLLYVKPGHAFLLINDSKTHEDLYVETTQFRDPRTNRGEGRYLMNDRETHDLLAKPSSNPRFFQQPILNSTSLKYTILESILSGLEEYSSSSEPIFTKRWKLLEALENENLQAEKYSPLLVNNTYVNTINLATVVRELNLDTKTDFLGLAREMLTKYPKVIQNPSWYYDTKAENSLKEGNLEKAYRDSLDAISAVEEEKLINDVMSDSSGLTELLLRSYLRISILEDELGKEEHYIPCLSSIYSTFMEIEPLRKVHKDKLEEIKVFLDYENNKQTEH